MTSRGSDEAHSTPMSETQYTPEPWRVEESDKYPSFTCVAHIGDVNLDDGPPRLLWVQGLIEAMPDEWEANARRIVAAVNACKGIPTEELEANGDSGVRLGFSAAADEVAERDMQIAALRAQLAAMRSALEAMPCYEWWDGGKPCAKHGPNACPSCKQRALAASGAGDATT